MKCRVKSVNWEKTNVALKLAPLGISWKWQSFLPSSAEEKQQEYLVHFYPYSFNFYLSSRQYL